MKALKFLISLFTVISLFGCSNNGNSHETYIYKYSNENAALSVLHYVSNLTLLTQSSQMAEDDFKSFRMVSGNSNVEENGGSGKVYMTYRYTIRGNELSLSASFSVTNYGIVAVRGTEATVVSNMQTELICPNFSSSEPGYVDVDKVNAMYLNYLETGKEDIRENNFESENNPSDSNNQGFPENNVQPMFSYYLTDDGYVITKFNNDNAKVVDIPSMYEGKPVVSIAAYAFEDCDSIISITIPRSIISIEEGAFSNCNQLSTINFEVGSKLESINEKAFENCYSLTEITLPNGVANIGDNAFYGCNYLTSITIPGSVTNIGNCAFFDCSSLTSITIPNSVKNMGYGSFEYCGQLRSVIFDPNSRLEDIGNSAFAGCYSLTNITIPSSIRSIGASAFLDCKQLQSISFDPESKIESIGYCAFANCEALTDFTIPNDFAIIQTMAFSGCNSLESLTLSSFKTFLGNYFGADRFEDNYIHVPKSLKSVTILSGNTIVEGAFYGCNYLTTIIIPSGVSKIEDSAFFNCNSLKEIVIPSTVTSIGTNVFNDCDSLIIYCEQSRPENWYDYLSDYYFDGCPVYWNYTANNVVNLDDFTYYLIDGEATLIKYNGSSNNVTLSDEIYYKGKTYKLTGIGNRAFYNCDFIERVDYMGTISQWATLDINDRSFNPLAMKKLYINGKLFQEENIVLEGIDKIGEFVFCNCDFIKTITIPNSVIEIKIGAFYYCQQLQRVIFESNSNLISIGDYAFENCESLLNIIIRNNVKSIGYAAFAYCSLLQNVNFEQESKLEYIGDYAFCETPLTRITIPKSVTVIGDFAFLNCFSLSIYCEVLSEPDGWSEYWNYDNLEVYWGRSA